MIIRVMFFLLLMHCTSKQRDNCLHGRGCDAIFIPALNPLLNSKVQVLSETRLGKAVVRPFDRAVHFGLGQTAGITDTHRGT